MARVILRDDEEEGDFEWIDYERDPVGHITKLVWHEEMREPDTPRYQPVRWTETTYTWRRRLKVYDVETRANSLYPGKPDDIIERNRIPALPDEILKLIV